MPGYWKKLGRKPPLKKTSARISPPCQSVRTLGPKRSQEIKLNRQNLTTPGDRSTEPRPPQQKKTTTPDHQKPPCYQAGRSVLRMFSCRVFSSCSRNASARDRQELLLPPVSLAPEDDEQPDEDPVRKILQIQNSVVGSHGTQHEPKITVAAIFV
eukprot:g41813.t1